MSEAPSSLNSQISEGLERIILTCLEKEPADRHASAKELSSCFKNLEAGDLSGLISRGLKSRAKQKKKTQDILEKLLEMSKRNCVPAHDVAVYVSLGETQQTFEWLFKACEERSGFLSDIKCDPRFTD